MTLLFQTTVYSNNLNQKGIKPKKTYGNLMNVYEIHKNYFIFSPTRQANA